MYEYEKNLREYMEKHKCKPEHGLASGTAIFCIKEENRSKTERKFVEKILKRYVSEIMDKYSPLEQVDIVQATKKILNKSKDQLTDSEKVIEISFNS